VQAPQTLEIRKVENMSRYKNPRTHFTWTAEMLVRIWEVGCTLKTDQEMGIGRKFPNANQLLKRFKHKHPTIVARYYTVMSKPLQANVLYDRLHKNYYGVTQDNTGRSAEHPLRNDKKNPFIGQLSLDLNTSPESSKGKRILTDMKKIQDVGKITTVQTSRFTQDELVFLIKATTKSGSNKLLFKLAQELSNVGTG